MMRTPSIAVVTLALQVPIGPQSAPATASISGSVTDGSGRPVVRAVVALGGPELRPAISILSDAEGKFAFTNLPSGRFTLTVSKPAYLTVAYGQPSPGVGAGVAIAVKDGERIGGVALKMPRGAVIIGKVVDDFGRPMPGAVILVMQPRDMRGEVRLTAVGPTAPRTDGQGMYRAYGLMPGDYAVVACPPGDYRVLDASCQSFSSGELRRVTAAELEWARRRVRSDAAAHTSAPPEPPEGRPVAYGAVFYPGATDETGALKVTLAAGEERDGVDFVMQLQPTARIEGRVVGPSGEPVPSVRMTFGPVAGGTMSMPLTDGTFSRRDLLPGRYWFEAQASGYSARADFVVNGEDITDVVLMLAPSVSISGRIVLDAAGKPRADVSTATVSLRSEASDAAPILPVRVQANGTFRIEPVTPGRYRLSASFPVDAGQARWTLASALVRGRDGVDLPFEVRPNESLSGIIVTLTDRATEIKGTVLDAAGRRLTGHHVVLFPVDRAYWSAAGRRFPPPARAATDGAFSFTGVPAGDYYVAAVAEVDPLELRTAAYLDRLARSATKVTLDAGEKKVLDRLSPSGR